MLKKLLPPTRIAARFEDDSLRLGVINQKEARYVCLFNWTDAPQDISFNLTKKSAMTDFWSGAQSGAHAGVFEVKNRRAHSARILVYK